MGLECGGGEAEDEQQGMWVWSRKAVHLPVLRKVDSQALGRGTISLKNNLVSRGYVGRKRGSRFATRTLELWLC